VVFIAAEEGGEKNVGVDKVLEKGKLEEAGNFMPWLFGSKKSRFDMLGGDFKDSFYVQPYLGK